MKRKIYLAFSAFILVAWPAHAADGVAASRHETRILSADRKDHGFAAQQALVYEKGRVLFSRNSNFLCGPSKRVSLGYFTSPYREQENLESRQVAALLSRLEGSHQLAPRKGDSPHQTSFHIGSSNWTQDVTDMKPQGQTVRRILEDACDTSRWAPDQAVTVEAAGKTLRLKFLGIKAQSKESVLTFEEAKCIVLSDEQSDTGAGELWKCTIPEWGQVQLLTSEAR